MHYTEVNLIKYDHNAKLIMAKVEHYRGLGTDLEKLYQSIKQVIEDEKDLELYEYKGTLNGIPVRNIVAVNTSAKVLVGQLSEIHVSITGNPNDYAVEVASNAWFGSLVWPALAGLAIGGPVGLAAGTAAGGTAGLAAGTAVGGIVAYEFERKMWKHVQEAVKKVSQVQPTLESVDTYHH
jgi:hypothetical protein